MGGDASGMAGIGQETAPAWDRFADWSKLPARLLLAVLVCLLAASALVPIKAGVQKVATNNMFEAAVQSGGGPARERDEDLALYDIAIERIRKGESYYAFIAEEHRKAFYPVRPALAVRLPTLAYVEAWIGVPGTFAAAIVLMLATVMAWWRRLGEEPGGQRYRIVGTALIFVGASLGVNQYFFVLHELWAGMLLALAFGLYRPGKWVLPLVFAAMALSIREHALPFVLLMAAMAFWRRDWKEGAAWTGLAAAFLAFLAVHLSIIAAQVLPSDPYGQGWLYLRGLSGWVSYFALSSNLRFLPGFIAGPLIVFAMLGWSAWKSPAGLFGFLLFAGYGLLFMIAGRPDTYYWGVMVAPALLVGLAFAVPALRALIGNAAQRQPGPQIRCA